MLLPSDLVINVTMAHDKLVYNHAVNLETASLSRMKYWSGVLNV